MNMLNSNFNIVTDTNEIDSSYIDSQDYSITTVLEEKNENNNNSDIYIFSKETTLFENSSTFHYNKVLSSNENYKKNKMFSDSLKKKKKVKNFSNCMLIDNYKSSFNDSIVSIFSNFEEYNDYGSFKCYSHFSQIIEMLDYHLQDKKHPISIMISAFRNAFLEEFKFALENKSSFEVKLKKAVKEINSFSEFISNLLISLYYFDDLKDQVKVYFFTNECILSYSIFWVFSEEIYQLLYKKIKKRNLEKEEKYLKKLVLLENCSAEFFGLTKQFSKVINNSEIENLFKSFDLVIKEFKKISQKKNPIDKILIIKKTSEKFIDSLKKYYKPIKIDLLNKIDLDDIVSLFLFIVVKAKIKNLCSQLEFIEGFFVEKLAMNNSGYCFLALKTSVEHLINTDFNDNIIKN